MLAIYKRELSSYFQTMIGNVFLAFLIAFVGIYFMAYNLVSGYNYFAYALGSGFLMMIVVVPILTMKSFSEERRSKTDQMLLTSPVKLYQIVLGKYLAMISVLAIACVIFCICPLIIKRFGEAHFLVDYLAIGVFFLIGCVYIAVGMFISSMTESQIIAAIGTMGLLLLLYFWDSLLSFLPTAALSNLLAVLFLLVLVGLLLFAYLRNWLVTAGFLLTVCSGSLIAYLVKSTLYENLLANTLDSLNLAAILTDIVDSNVLNMASIIFLFTLIGLFNFFTMQVMQKRRWS